MTQKSWPWSTVAGLGDGAAELTEALSREFLAVYFGVQDPAVEGVSKGVLGELAVSGSATPLSVQPGSAICYGLYINDDVVNLAVSTPAVNTTGGRVVLQTNWAGTGGGSLEARTRLAIRMSADGNPAIPALVQSFGTTWEISLATFTITTGGAITVTDDRTFRKSTALVAAGGIDPDVVTNANLRNSAAVSVIGRAANSSGDPADIAAGANDRLLRRTGDALNFGQLTAGMFPAGVVPVGGLADGAVNATAKLANDIVDDTKVGNRVPQFYRRQGGSDTNWAAPGTTERTPGDVRMQGGAIEWSGGAALTGNLTVTFPNAFSQVPLVYVNVIDASGGTGPNLINANISALSASQASITWRSVDGATTHTSVLFTWLAIGAE